MRILFSSTRGAGHVQPLIPYAHALLRRGHEVHVAAPESVDAVSKKEGLTHSLFDHPGDEVLGSIWARFRGLSNDEINAMEDPRRQPRDPRRLPWHNAGGARHGMSGRLPSCTAAEVARALEHGGFVAVHQKGSHRYFADPITGEVLTTVPMHVGDISRSLLKKIIKDVRLTEEEFRKLL